MLQEKVWAILVVMMVVPFVFPLIIPDPYAAYGMIGTNLFFLFLLRKNFKAITGKLFGSSTKLVCSTCGSSKADRRGTCTRCGSKSRKIG